MGGSNSKLEKQLGPSFPDGEKLMGFENFGNTCYCNSVLQALYFCLPFRNKVLECYKSPVELDEESATLLSCLVELFQSISQNKRRSGVISPKLFVNTLKKENELFRGMMHQDAHEFLNFLLNDMIEQLNGSKAKELQNNNHNHNNGNGGGNNNGKSSGSNNNNNHSNSKNSPKPKTWVQDIFEGTITSETKCLCCETVTSRDESFLDLSLEIGENCSVTSCLKNFSSMETLNGRDKFYCNCCASLQEAKKRIVIKRLPNILALHLKRFKFVESLQRFKKLSHRVVFPAQLKLFNVIPSEDTNKSYELFAVVVHVGSGINHGHYISAVKIQDNWILFDDDNVEVIDETVIQSFFGLAQDGPQITESGYILFYQCVNDDANNNTQSTQATR